MADIHPIVKPWPFRGWVIDIIGKIYPTSKNHGFLMIATDYFTKWVEVVPIKKVEHSDMVEFVKEHLIYRFGIPESITTDQGTMFTGGEFRLFAEDFGIKLINLTPYYPQANGQAEANNKVIISMLEKMMDDNPRVHDVVLPMEIVIPSLRVARQNSLTAEDYSEAMVMELEQLEKDRIQAFNRILVQKKKIARAYNKWVKKMIFHEVGLHYDCDVATDTRVATDTHVCEEKVFDRSSTMCNEKWRNLLKEYKKVRHHDKRSGGSDKACTTTCFSSCSL
ncbi:uncharacterized protein LOC119980737 [Tripterygium wilfordii]|uniref:uncharacterized protein LOC119980737 n=1 Tax=Tripterygium wilfordii TaxID=458696 RepID=UPI0018F8140B|nr:uncharacterized protein LOC119980737 [Tripterygium wilfordii]